MSGRVERRAVKCRNCGGSLYGSPETGWKHHVGRSFYCPLIINGMVAAAEPRVVHITDEQAATIRKGGRV